MSYVCLLYQLLHLFSVLYMYICAHAPKQHTQPNLIGWFRKKISISPSRLNRWSIYHYSGTEGGCSTCLCRLCPLITESLSLIVTKLHETEASYFPVSILYSSIIQVLTGPHLLTGWFRYNLSISTMPPPRRRYARVGKCGLCGQSLYSRSLKPGISLVAQHMSIIWAHLNFTVVNMQFIQ